MIEDRIGDLPVIHRHLALGLGEAIAPVDVHSGSSDSTATRRSGFWAIASAIVWASSRMSRLNPVTMRSASVGLGVTKTRPSIRRLKGA